MVHVMNLYRIWHSPYYDSFVFFAVKSANVSKTDIQIMLMQTISGCLCWIHLTEVIQ